MTVRCPACGRVTDATLQHHINLWHRNITIPNGAGIPPTTQVIEPVDGEL